MSPRTYCARTRISQNEFLIKFKFIPVCVASKEQESCKATANVNQLKTYVLNVKERGEEIVTCF